MVKIKCYEEEIYEQYSEEPYILFTLYVLSPLYRFETLLWPFVYFNINQGICLSWAPWRHLGEKRLDFFGEKIVAFKPYYI